MREIATQVGVSPWFVRDHVRRHRAEGLRLTNGHKEITKVKPVPVAKKVAAKFAKAHAGQGVGLMDLNADTCRWPLGAIDDPVEWFCGRAPFANSSYCEYHHSHAYEATKFKVRRPRWA